MADPKISVLMPVYNAEKYLDQAIVSILAQSFKDFEFIIVDDLSTDSSLEIIRRHAKNDKRIVILENKKNLNISRSLTRGLQIAKADLVARMDADDWSFPDRLEHQYNFMTQHPQVVVSGGTIITCDADLQPVGSRRYNKTDRAIRDKLFRYSPFAHPALIYRKEIVDKVGGYNILFIDAEDYDLYFRLGKEGTFANLSQPLIKYRMNDASISNRRARQQEYFTLYIRLKAVMEYGYRPTTSDTLYSLAQLLSCFVIPQKLKIKLYRLFRDNKG